MFEEVGEPKDFNQSRLQLVKKKEGMEHMTNSHLVPEGVLFVRKKIIKEKKDHWYYR